MVKKAWQTDRQTDGRTDGLNQSYSCLVAAKKVIILLTIALSAASKVPWGHYQPTFTGKRQTLWKEICFPLGNHTTNASDQLGINKAGCVFHCHSAVYEVCKYWGTLWHSDHILLAAYHIILLLSFCTYLYSICSEEPKGLCGIFCPLCI